MSSPQELKDSPAQGEFSKSETIHTDQSTGGQKATNDVRMDLIPVEPIWWLARVYGYGANKYDDRNWERGYDWSLSYAALQRHLTAWWGGEDIDPDSGHHHLSHGAWHIFTLIYFTIHYHEGDDRSSVG